MIKRLNTLPCLLGTWTELLTSGDITSSTHHSFILLYSYLISIFFKCFRMAYCQSETFRNVQERSVKFESLWLEITRIWFQNIQKTPNFKAYYIYIHTCVSVCACMHACNYLVTWSELYSKVCQFKMPPSIFSHPFSKRTNISLFPIQYESIQYIKMIAFIGPTL